MIKFMNLSLLNRIDAIMKGFGIDWRLERQQRGKLVWSHALIRNMTGDEADAHVMLYIDCDANIIYPVIWVNGAAKYQYLRDKVADQEDVTELSEAEYELLGEKNHDRVRIYKLEDCKFTNSGSVIDWVNHVIDHTKRLLKVMQSVLY